MSRQAEVKKHCWTDATELDWITKMMFMRWDDLFSMDQDEVESFRHKAAKERVETLLPQIKILATQAENAGFKGIESTDDLVPLLFQHGQYKSYPMSLLEKCRFDQITKWLNGLTTTDISGVDASECKGIDEWIALLEAETSLRPSHTSGTSGKLSFFPRNNVERDLWVFGQLKMFEGYGDTPGIELGFDGLRIPCIHPSMRYGSYDAQRIVQFLCKHVAPSPEQVYTLTNGTLSADLVSLSGRVRIAQSKGELEKMQFSDTQRATFKRYLEEIERRPQEVNAFMQKMETELAGQQVFICSQTSYLVQAAQEGLSRGIKGVFSPNSIGLHGGGGKGVVLPDNWEQLMHEFTGITKWVRAYGMTEIIGTMPMCSERYYHIPPYHIPFLLDPQTREPLPRTGTQTGQFACMDLLPFTYWGGLVTGDKVTIEWDAKCSCGRKGPRVQDNIVRYSELVTGDDKITCSAAVDNTDEALQKILAL